MYDIAKEYKEMIYVALSWILTLAKSLVVQWANGRNDLCCLSWILTLAKRLVAQNIRTMGKWNTKFISVHASLLRP